ncbi:phosphomethylpyrimidine synthase ThiC [Carboxydothermus hydrogenoformans]|uniref:Phosphomethylpyrimidine synthase n=1 Tax=Carboxydothermus hydrogenoformans (strain ATCC BAA-161 / DSM 6008 / Z-2901) TaxID=246194 RepID=THIC_CARHZ|nr:phosphomethylpyrimidine synthase ThiC [Carboxydothermus hydrogenoformans]Q3AE33.1 RecName: Full=Phosphomethylpyrimidine synthase; AltName: Full=Hydroxymethylpyrimidine phosphate synthase; Short=HMP-P synthase; Short=HMP-phosphate synthase; Short=HMPP synthase; AltName: Full=Thiamine biosynthesis protein ThiC [Carboxydothermus hydrogenoformans Z-2901]ABB14730.1 thiamine biosynthesis protein ThiC [Carboxydothermus hydrogenoformans Z-2901]
MTQLLKAKEGVITREMEVVAAEERKSPEEIRQKVALGEVVIPANVNHQNLHPKGIGAGLKVKVNANLGTSENRCFYEDELKKVKVAIKAGADAIMDLSTGGNLDEIRRAIIKESSVPVGTVPLYQAAAETLNKYGDISRLDPELLFDVIEKQAADGVDFMTVHVGVTREILKVLDRFPRVTEVVSRGGSLTIAWMEKNGRENPLYEQFDRLLAICRKYDVTLSLGDGLRPGSIADATDQLQIMELMKLGELVKYAQNQGVQVMVEGPGHVPINQIEMNVKLMKRLCANAPFYVLGPLVTDIAPGYDHITAAIGGAWAAYFGADFLCYVTPAEHLGLPTVEDVEEGVIALKIAAHAADLARGNREAWNRDYEMSVARKELNWERQFELAINPERARKMRIERGSQDIKSCSMCGELCAMKIMNERGGKNA